MTVIFTVFDPLQPSLPAAPGAADNTVQDSQTFGLLDQIQSGALQSVIRDQVRDHDHPRSSLVLYGIRAAIIGPLRAWKPPIPYAIKKQRGAS